MVLSIFIKNKIFFWLLKIGNNFFKNQKAFYMSFTVTPLERREGKSVFFL